MATAAQREAAEERLRYDTPFWAGGVTRDSSGRWVTPAPGAFQGVAKILDKRKQIVPAIAKPWQLEFDAKLEEQRAAGLPMRALILKARKLGFSTWVALKFLQRVTQLQYQLAIVVAQDVSTAGAILEMAKRAYTMLPSEEQLGFGFSIKPALIRVAETDNGRKHMVFGEPSKLLRNQGRAGDSTFAIDTAGSPAGMRGLDPNMLHLSEVAFWEAAQAMKKMLSALEALAYMPETICVLESTANGLNHFYRRWMSAKQGTADEDTGEVYVPIFVPWWRDPDCSRPFATAEARDRFVGTIGVTAKYGEVVEDEPMLMELYDCTPEQLMWRRMKIQEQPDKSVHTFNQENPHSDEAAFIGSGRTVFPGILVAKAIRSAEAAPAPVVGSLRVGEAKERRTRSGSTIIPQSALWVPSERMAADAHELLVWEHPRKAEAAPADASEFERREGAYCLALDTSLGEADTFGPGDFHALTVFDWHTRVEVAKHVSRMDIHLLPEWVLLVALYFNEARVAVEVNSGGIAVVDPLAKSYRYKRMYRRERIDTTKSHEVVSKPGWATDGVTKPAMEANLMALLDSDLRGGVRDPLMARELSTYIVNEKGKHEAQHGEHDDRLMAWMIAQMVMSMRRPPKIGGKRVEEGFAARDPLTGY